MSSRRAGRYSEIGLDRLVRLAWLEQTARLVQAGADPGLMRSSLLEVIQGQLRSKDAEVRGSIDKTLTILRRVWAAPPQELEGLRNAGLDLLASLDAPQRLAVHWGMVMAAYPFWSEVAATTGRLLRVQGSVVSSQVQRRVRETYGERETASRRVRYLLRSFVDWGVLLETDTKGVFQQGRQVELSGAPLVAWLLEALLWSLPEHSMELASALGSPSLFPFEKPSLRADQLQPHAARLSLSSAGFQQDLVSLRITPSLEHQPAAPSRY